MAGGMDRAVPAAEDALHRLAGGVVLARAVPLARRRRPAVPPRPELERVEDRLARPDETVAAGPGSHLGTCLCVGVLARSTRPFLSLVGESASENQLAGGRRWDG